MEALTKRRGEGYASAFCIGYVHLELGEDDTTMTWFERAYRDRDLFCPYMELFSKVDSTETRQSGSHGFSICSGGSRRVGRISSNPPLPSRRPPHELPRAGGQEIDEHKRPVANDGW